MMKQEYVDIVAEAFRKGEFKAVTGGAPIMRSYDEAYLDERTDYDFDHMYIHLMKDEREGGFIEVFSVDTSDEYMTNHSILITASWPFTWRRCPGPDDLKRIFCPSFNTNS